MLDNTELNFNLNLQPNTVIGYNEILKELMSIQEDICSDKKDEALKKIAQLTIRIMDTMGTPTNAPLSGDNLYHLPKTLTANGYNYDCCKNCPNNPANGGSGICNCTLPYFQQTPTWNPYDLTCKSDTSMQVHTGVLTKMNETITE